MSLHFFGKLTVEPTLANRVPSAAKELAHVGLTAALTAALRRTQDLMNREDQPVEFLALGGELLAAGGGQRVVARASIVLRRPSLALHPAFQQQTLEGRVQRAFPDL